MDNWPILIALVSVITACGLLPKGTIGQPSEPHPTNLTPSPIATLLPSTLDTEQVGSTPTYPSTEVEPASIFQIGEQQIYDIAWSPDGESLAAGNESIVIWDAETGDTLHTFTRDFARDEFSVSSLAFSPDGRLIASGWFDGRIIVWNVQSREEVLDRDERRIISSLAFAPDGSLLAIGAYSDPWSHMAVLTVESGDVLFTLDDVVVTDLAFSPAGTELLAGLYNNRAVLIDLNSYEILLSIETSAPYESVGNVLFDESGETFITALNDSGSLRQWDTLSGEQIRAIESPEPDVRNTVTQLSQDGSKVASSLDYGQEIVVWETETRKILQRLASPDGKRYSSMSWSPDGKHLATGTFHGEVIIWDSP